MVVVLRERTNAGNNYSRENFRKSKNLLSANE